jgi:DNA-directed RNA polymerase specialized sigma24 family protein
MLDPMRRPWTDPGRDPELLYAAQGGDLAALFTLLRERRAELWRVCFALTLDRSQAEQLFHETLLRAAKNLRSVPNGTSLLPWIVRLAANLATHARREAGQGATPLPPVSASLGRTLAPNEAMAVAAFAKLPEADRLLMALAAIEHVPYGEIGAITRRENTAVIHQLALIRARMAGEQVA